MLSASLEHMVLQFFEDLDSSFSLKCAILWRYGEIESLVRLECRPEDYETPERYFRAVSAVALVKKLQGLDIKVDRRAAAIQKWWEGELSCYKTNLRLYGHLPGKSLAADDRVIPHVAGIREVVLELIGYGPPELLLGRFGPGATFADRGERTTVPDKMTSDPTLTSDCVWFLPQFFGTAWGRYTASEKALSFVRGNRFTTVPKTSVVDRSIAIEPSVNVFFQLAAGRALRSALMRSHGWNLDTAQDVHRSVARQASVTREFATLDLSNASDTVAYNLVRLLLPHRWFEALDALRSPFTTHPDGLKGSDGKVRWVKLEKFSSMGNGYTFELETVLFAALAIYSERLAGGAGVLGYDTFVFGDDIICKDGTANLLTAMLSYFGFTLNKEKSFVGDSPFRESCGADYYVGADVRPSYLKDEPRNVQDNIGVANRLYSTFEKIASLGGTSRRSSWFYAVRLVPLPYRNCRGPRGLGDAVVWDQEYTWRMRWQHSIRYIQAVVPGDLKIVAFKNFKPQVVLACALYGTGNVGTPERGRVPSIEGVTPRDAVRSHRVGWLAYS